MTDPTPAAPPAVPDVATIIAKLNALIAAIRATERTPDRMTEVRAAFVVEDALRRDLQDMIAALTTHQAATERVVAAAEAWYRTRDDPTGGMEPHYANCDALFAAVAALRATRDGGE